MQCNKMAVIGALGIAATMLGGCRMESHTNGDNKDVNIATPFGGLHVKTNQGLENIGLPAYPGAQPAKKDNGNDDNDSADVNMSFGSFQLRVKAASFRTGDAPDKVEAFYRNGLKRYGDVIACKDQHPVGTASRTGEGLTCDNEKSGHITVADDMGKHRLELKAGSKQHQHVVTLDTDGDGTKFELVALDLPGKFFSNDGDGQDQPKQ